MLDDFLEKFRLDDLPDFRQIIYLKIILKIIHLIIQK